MHDRKLWRAFLEEASFTKEILAIGVTQLYKANYAAKGIYYQSFTCLSTGVERLAKLCLILDFYIQNHGVLPSEKYIRGYSHKIPELYLACRGIALRQKIGFRFRYAMDEAIQYAIIDLLGAFAESSGRYSNINILLGADSKSNDCMELWYTQVDLPIYQKHISQEKKNSIESNARAIGRMMNQFAVVRFTSEEKTELTDAAESSRRTGIWEAVAPYRQFYMLQIIRYFVELLIGLGHKAGAIDPEEIPHFGEIFGLFYNDNEFFRSRKTWDTL